MTASRGSTPASARQFSTICGCGLEGASSAVCVAMKWCFSPCVVRKWSRPRRALPVAMASSRPSPSRRATVSRAPGKSGIAASPPVRVRKAMKASR